METYDEDLELDLAQFRPRPVKALDVPIHTKSLSPGWVIAATLVVLVGGTAL